MFRKKKRRNFIDNKEPQFDFSSRLGQSIFFESSECLHVVSSSFLPRRWTTLMDFVFICFSLWAT
jgi:hypothetical protein